MTSSSHYIAQIQEAEENAKNIIQKIEQDNNSRITTANEETAITVKEAEEKARLVATNTIGKAKEEAKAEYKKIMINAEVERRNIIEKGNKNILNSEKHVNNAFTAIFKTV